MHGSPTVIHAFSLLQSTVKGPQRHFYSSLVTCHSSLLMTSQPIGIFDSGVGGLTVLRAVRQRLPNEGIIYLGDTARVPYGTKSRATIERYAIEDSDFLVSQNIKLLVIACNTASAMARDLLRQHFSLPILSVVGPGARAAARATRTGRIGVIATEATIESRAYEIAIETAFHELRENPTSPLASRALPGSISFFGRACPLFVPLVEEGELDSQIARLLAEQYLSPLRESNIDTLVLGCTHYPLLRGVISETIGEGVTLVDSAEATADEVAALLATHHLLNDSAAESEHRFFVTDAANRFHRIAKRILGGPLPHLEAIELGVPRS
jgi:glutamate racemase